MEDLANSEDGSATESTAKPLAAAQPTYRIRQSATPGPAEATAGTLQLDRTASSAAASEQAGEAPAALGWLPATLSVLKEDMPMVRHQKLCSITCL